LKKNAIALFKVYKDKIDATMSARRFLLNQQKNLLEAATAMLALSLLILFSFSCGFKREFCFVFTNLAWFISFLGMIALYLASYQQQEDWMVTRSYCTKEN